MLREQNNDIQNLFFELMQVSVGNRDSLSWTPTGLEWQALYEESQRQAVAGIILCGIGRLPEDQRPLKTLLLQWIAFGEMLKQRNLLFNKACIELQSVFSNHEFKSCILKGQGNALLYVNPLLRQCGDIDIWVKGDRNSILAFLREKGKIGSVDIKHCDWDIFQNVPVEVHFMPSWFYNPIINNKIQKWFKAQSNVLFENESELGFNVPTVSFNLVYVLIHIYRHLFDDGIGLRQLMDYYYVLLHSSQRERKNAMSLLNSLRMKRFVGAIMYVLQAVFKLDSDYWMTQPLVNEGRFLLNEIMRAGNFGHFDDRNKNHHSRLATGFENVKRNLRFLGRYSHEVYWMPAWKIWHWLWRKMNGYI